MDDAGRVMMTEAQEAKEPEAKLDVGKILQGLASAVVLLVGGLYAVGLLIVNVHLSRYGLVSLDLARPEYAMAGALWGFLTAVVYGAAAVEVRLVRRCYTERKYVSMIFWAIGLGGLVYLNAVLGILIAISRGAIAYELDAIPTLVALVVNGLTVGMFINEAKAVMKLGKVSAGVLFELSEKQGPNRVYLMLWALFGISLYAAIVYPTVPREYGGGLSSSVRLFLTTKADKWTSDLGVSGPGADGSIGPVALLMESEGYFIVARTEFHVEKLRWYIPPTIRGMGTGPAVGIDKKIVSAIVYLPRSFTSPQTKAEPLTKTEPATKAGPSANSTPSEAK